MLETVDRIERSPLQRPEHVREGEVVAALRALAFASSDDAAQKAYHRVLYAVGNDHCGSYFPIVLDVVPFLGEILAEGSQWARAGALDVLVDLLGSFGPDQDVAEGGPARPEELPAVLCARVEQLRPTLEQLVADRSAPDVQRLAKEVIECLSGER
jgi:hypothetical protein